MNKTRKIALTNGRLILPDTILSDAVLIIQGPTITQILPQNEFEAGTEQFDVDGRYIAPGFIDIHTHGALGRSFNEPTSEAYETITAANAHHGTTALLATTASAPIPNLSDCLSACRYWMQQAQPGARVLGMHLEGPYFCPAQAGAQNPAHLRTPNDGTPDLLLEHAPLIKMMSYAPELSGAHALTTQLVKKGIVAAAGHSCADDDEVFTAVENGLSHAIHLWSGQSTTHYVGPWRKPGLLEASLASTTLTAEIIADNKHLPPTLMKLAYRCLGPDRLCAVSDATAGAGLPEGAQFDLAGLLCEVRDGVAMLLDATSFAGSTTFLGQMLPILVNVTGISLPEAVRMMTLTPARIIGADTHLGSLQPGKYADLNILNNDLTIHQTMANGRWLQ